MPTLAEYEDWKAGLQKSSIGAANVVLSDAQTVNPDQFAGDIKLGKAFGLPAGIVAEGRDGFAARLQSKRNETILKSSPLMASWLGLDDNAKVAHDDLENLSWFEAFGRGAVATAQRAHQRVDQMGNQYMLEQTAGRASDRGMTFGQILDDERDTLQGPNPGETHKAWAGIGDILGASARYLDAQFADLIGTDDKAAATQFAAGVAAAQERMAATPKSAIAQSFEDAAVVKGVGLGESLVNFGSAFLNNPIGGLSWAVETAGESAPQLAAALGATATAGPGAGLAVLGTGSYLTERYTAPTDFLAENGIDISKPGDVQRLLSDPKMLEDAANRGVIRGAIIGAFDVLSGGIAGKALAKNPFVEALAQSVQQAVFGSAGEYSARVAAGQEIDWSDVLAEGFAEIATTPVDMGIAGRKFNSERRAAKAAERAQVTADQIAQAAQTSKLKQRLDGRFMDWVNSAVSGSPVENVYVPAEAMNTYFQGARIDPEDFLAELPGASMEEFRAALATGGDLKIPTGTYAAKIAGTEFDPFLRANMRFDPDAMTLTQAKDFNERVADIQQEAFEEAENQRLADEELRSHEQVIYDEMVSRLRAAGRATDVATNEAMMWPAFYRSMAERSGLTTEELLQAFPLPKVEGVRPEGLQPKNVDELTRTLAMLRGRSAGAQPARESLLEFIDKRGGINDPGGELAARDAAIIQRGKGKKTLRIRRGVGGKIKDMFGGGSEFSLDNVAQAAVESGYLSDDPRVQAWKNAVASGEQAPDITAALLDAIDGELAGKPSYSQDQIDERQKEKDAALDNMEEWLSRRGISLDQPDAEIRAAILAQEAEDGRKYGQAPLLFQSGNLGPRGQIQFPAAGIGQGDTVINLFEKANLSTFLHESGHMFLSVTQAIASGPNAPSDVVGMFDTVKAWWRSNAADVARDAHTVTGLEISAADVEAAIDNGTTGDAAKDSAIDVGMQEQFARGFEAYMMEGKSPSIELRSAFERFRAWLLNIYKRVVNLGVNLSPEIRTVFDRMLASDAEIERARTTVDDEMIFKTAAEAGISEEQFKALAKLHNQAQDEAKQKLLKEAMAPVQREREKWFKNEKAKVREEVEKDINGQRAYRALEWLGNRRWLGDGKPEEMPDMRMSKDMLVEQYGEGVLKTLPRGKFTVYTVEGGMDPDEIAGWFGYNSGDELVKALETAPTRKDAIEAETDRLMRERHGDVLRDGSVEEAALEAVHGDKRGQYLAAELKTLKALAGDTSADITMQDAREIARRTLNRMQVRDAINSRRYLAAERRHADDVIRLSRITTRERMRAQDARRDVGNTAREGIRSEDAAALEKTNAQVERANVPTDRANDRTAELVKAARNRLVNHALYAESIKIADEVEKAERFVGKLSKRSTRDRLAGDYLDAIDEILDRYDFRRLSARAETRRGALLAYVERMTEDGRENELSIPDYVIAEAKRTPYKQLSVEYLRGVVDTLKNIEHTARLKRKLIDAKRERDLDATVDGILGSFNGNVKGKPPARTKSGRNPIRSGVGQYINLVKNADTILREIDGFKDGGAAYQAIKAPIDEQHAELIVQRREAAEKFEQLYSVYSRDERRTMAAMKSVPELGGEFSKWDLISIALNTGNEDNFQRMTDRRVEGSFTPEQVTAAMARLNAKDADFVQSVWDLVNSYWPQIEARERRISGVAPEKVQARPVTIGGKELAGGYYPLKYDSELSSIASDDESVDLMANMKGGRFGKAQTRNGHLKERAKSSGKPVMIDIGVLHGHINQVIHDLALSEVVNNSWKILQDRRLKDAFINTGKKADFDTLEIWLQDVATGEMKPADIFNKLARRARSGFTVSKLALNISTVFLQPTGNVQSMVVVGKKNFALGVTDLFRYDSTPWKSINAAAADVMAMSPFMRERQSTFQKDIYDILGDTRAGPTEGRASRLMREVIAPLGFWTMQKAQFYTADLPTWFGGYRKAIADGASHEDAIARADRVVARAQGSGIFSDRSAIERGSLSRNVRQQDTVRLFTALGSYMFAKFNVAYEKTAQTDFTDPRAALIWASDMALLFTVEAVLYALVHNQLPGGDDDEEGWGEFLLEETALSVMGTLPFFREAAGALQGFNGGGAYGSVMDTLAKPFIQARQGELDVPFVKSVVNLAGMTLMLPSTQINRVIEATWGKNSDDQSPMEWIRRASIGGK